MLGILKIVYFRKDQKAQSKKDYYTPLDEYIYWKFIKPTEDAFVYRKYAKVKKIFWRLYFYTCETLQIDVNKMEKKVL